MKIVLELANSPLLQALVHRDGMVPRQVKRLCKDTRRKSTLHGNWPLWIDSREGDARRRGDSVGVTLLLRCRCMLLIYPGGVP